METHEPALKYETSLWPSEFINWERNSVAKHEYADGKIIAMAGASIVHNRILSNVIIEVGNLLKNKPCNIYPSDLRVYVKSRESYFYPDATIICGDIEYADEEKDTIRNPSVIFEILSPSTEEYDTGKKLFFYMQIESLQQYIMVNSTSLLVRSVKRQADGAWRFQELEQADEKLLIEPISFGMSLADIYEGISFPKSSSGLRK
jgi:Uma2 family endonuclease